MTITTQAGAIAGLMPPVAFIKQNLVTVASAGQVLSYFVAVGNPAAGTPNTGLTGANYVSSSAVPAGILYHQDPPSGNAYLAGLSVAGGLAGGAQPPGTLMLCDRLWDCGPSTGSTSAQSISQPTLPARDAQGGTSGYGVQLGIEVVATTSATAAVISVSYTDPINGSGRTGAFVDLPLGSAGTAVGRFFRIGLQAGDVGVQSVQSVTFSTDWTSGTIALVAYRVLAVLDLPLCCVTNKVDAVSGPLPRLYNGVCPYLVLVSGSPEAWTLSGIYQETQG
jgi:hypothetical protein